MKSFLSHGLYLALLIFSIVGLTIADQRYNLAWWHDRSATIKTIGLCYLLLLAGDVGGIGLGIFSTNPSYVSGIYIVTPNLPVEEIFFLYLLCYVTLLTVIVEQKVMHRV